MYRTVTFSTKKLRSLFLAQRIPCLLFGIRVIPSCGSLRSLTPHAILVSITRRLPKQQVAALRPRRTGRDFDAIFRAAWPILPWTSQTARGSSQTFFHPFSRYYMSRASLSRCVTRKTVIHGFFELVCVCFGRPGLVRTKIGTTGADTLLLVWPPSFGPGHGGSVATLELRRSLAIASTKLDRHLAKQAENEAVHQNNPPTRSTLASLAFADHMDRLVAGDRTPSSPKRAKMLAGVNPALDRPVILFKYIVEVLHRSMSAVPLQSSLGLELHDGWRIIIAGAGRGGMNPQLLSSPFFPGFPLSWRGLHPSGSVS